MEKETIAAISTPIGAGAVGIVRISGTNAKKALKNVWISEHNPVDNFITHRLYYGKLSTGEARDHHIIDNVLAVWMKAPHSYTGEDVIEIHCHGGSFSTKSVLNAVLGSGARPAEPGEFTKRAFLNRRMDLAQAEAVADVISATSERALKIANEQLDGRLSRAVHEILAGLKDAKAEIEATIDFPEEDDILIEELKGSSKIVALKKKIEELLSTYDEGRLLHDGVKVTIVGKPNVGKSSLLNALAGRDRAIVHHSPGTTRDTIEERLEIDGMLFSITDTAGLRDASCEIERMGVERTKEKIGTADINLVVLDASRPLDDEDSLVLQETDGVKRIIVLNKSDIAENKDEETFDFDDLTKKISTSAVTGEGLPALKMALSSVVHRGGINDSEGVVITNLRHRTSLEEAENSLDMALAAVERKESAEFIAHHMQMAMDSLMKITGEVTTEDVLNEIFSRFCIGK